MHEHLDVSLVQPRLSWGDPGSNRRHLEDLIDSAPGADLYVLPETFTTGFLGEGGAGAEDMSGPTVAWMRELAARHGAVITGSAAIMDGQARYNRLLFVEADGRVQYYDKRHLFAFAGEDRRYAAGTARVVFDYRGWRICPQVCYDLRFPAWCRNRGDYDLLLFVANWPAPRIQAWSTLLSARAIENQAWVVAVNRVGEDGRGVQYNGQSAIYDPLGAARVPPWDGEGVRTAELSLDTVREVREQLPFAAQADDFEIRI